MEYPVVFKVGQDDLLGMLTTPCTQPARGIAAIVLPGGGFVPSTNRNRLSVQLARKLAAEGMHTFRFDYHGVGESGGLIDTYWLDRPFVEDLLGAVRYLESIGLQRLVLVGSCFGTRTILMAVDRIKGIQGAILISAPLRDYRMGDKGPSRYARDLSVPQLIRKGLQLRLLRELLAPQSREGTLRLRHMYLRTAALKTNVILSRFRMRAEIGGGRAKSHTLANDAWISRLFLSGFRELLERKVPLLMVYGTEEDFYTEFLQARDSAVLPLFGYAPAGFDVHTIEGVVHGFTTLEVQQAVIDVVHGWTTRLTRSN